MAYSNGRMRIPKDKIIAYIEKHFDYKTRKNNEEYLICNPFTGDTKYKMNINPERGVVHCWTGNEWAGPINPSTNNRNCSFINFVKIYRKCSYTAAISEIMGTSVDIKSYLRPENRISEAEIEKCSIMLPKGVEPLVCSDDSQAAILINWLKSRGYTLEDIEKYDLQHLGMDVYWPYYEFDTLVYWQSRSRLNKRFNFPKAEIHDKAGKLIGKTEGTKGDFLYGFDNAESASYLIVTEAIFDQHTLGEQALASGGAILTDKQIKKIKILGPKKGVILSPDNDEAGIQSVIANYRLLNAHDIKTFYSIPPSIQYKEHDVINNTKDWNEMHTKLKMQLTDIRKIHDDRIKPINELNLYKLLVQAGCNR